jgi:Glycine zipper/Protein of unknown function, DUF255
MVGSRFWWLLALLLTVEAHSTTGLAQELSGIKWRTDYATARKEAEAMNLPILLYFMRDASPVCSRMEKEPFTDPRITKLLGQYFIPLQLNSSHDWAMANQMGIFAFPTLITASSDGHILKSKVGFQTGDDLHEWLQQTLAILTSSEKKSAAENLESKAKSPLAPKCKEAICKVYALSELGDPKFAQWIAGTIPEVIQASSWSNNEPDKGILRYNAPAQILIISHTAETHAQIAEFLQAVKNSLPQNKSSTKAAPKYSKQAQQRNIVPRALALGVDYCLQQFLEEQLDNARPRIFFPPSPPYPLVKDVMVWWDDCLHLTQDPLRDGATLPGLKGRAYFFSSESKLADASGQIVVNLYDSTPTRTGGEATQLVTVSYDMNALKQLKRKDQIGDGYTLFIPWEAYNPAVKEVMLRLAYLPDKGVPIYPEPYFMNLKPPSTPDPKTKDTVGNGLIGTGLGAAVGAATQNSKSGVAVGGLVGAGVGGMVGADQDRRNARDKYIQAQNQTVADATRNMMSLRDVIDLTQRGIQEDIIIQQINKTKSVFSLTADDIVELQQNGVSPRVISYMQQRRSIVVVPSRPNVYVPFPSPLDTKDQK